MEINNDIDKQDDHSKDNLVWYRENVTRVSRFIWSSISVILLITIVVIYQFEQSAVIKKRLQEAVDTAKAKLISTEGNLQEIFQDLFRQKFPNIPSEADTILLVAQDIPNPKETILSPEISLSRIDKRYEEIRHRIKTAVNREYANAINHTIYLLDTYRKIYIKRIKNHKEYNKAINEQKESGAKTRRSIPTPFGTFDLDLKLALIILEFSTIACALIFHINLGRIRKLIPDQFKLNTGSSNLYPVPFWLFSYNLKNNLTHTVPNKHLTKLLGSIAIHIFWPVLAIVILWKCYEFQAIQTRIFGVDEAWLYISWIGIFFLIYLAIHNYVPNTILYKEPSKDEDHTLDRRAFLGLSITSVLMYLTSLLFIHKWVLDATKKVSEAALRATPVKTELSPVEGLLNVANLKLVVNQRNNIIHHEKVCKHHIPKQQIHINVIEKLESDKLHYQKSPRILEVLADQIISHNIKKEMSDNDIRKEPIDEKAVEFLRQAINASPFSYHLYHKLIRYYGRHKKYDKIRKFLDDHLGMIKTKIQGEKKKAWSWELEPLLKLNDELLRTKDAQNKKSKK